MESVRRNAAEFTISDDNKWFYTDPTGQSQGSFVAKLILFIFIF